MQNKYLLGEEFTMADIALTGALNYDSYESYKIELTGISLFKNVKL